MADARIRSPSCFAVASAIAAGTSTLAWNASVSSSGTTTISSKPARTSLPTTVWKDGLDRSRNACSMRRSGRIARTSSTSAVMDAAERGSRLPWANAMRAGAVMSEPPLGSGCGGGVVDDVVEVWSFSVAERMLSVVEPVETHQWIPHSVLLVPAQRPLRGSSPGATRRVQGQQPIDG